LTSAIAATAEKETVAARGHKIEGVLGLPLVVDDAFEGLTKAKEVEDAFTSFGFDAERYTRSREPQRTRRQRQTQRQKNEASRWATYRCC
jgi:large subunit ribosomal protein L4e